MSDPQSNLWNRLDSDMMQRLSARKWVSMDIEKALNIPPSSLTTFLQSDLATASNFHRELSMGPKKFNLALEYIHGPEQSSRADDATDVFHAGMPGTLSLEELEETVDLGQWRLKLGQSLFKLEVKKAS